MVRKVKRDRRESNRPIELRIIGGRWRGSKLQYNGDPGTRPMKDRTREAIFNLIGPDVKGKQAIDLFAGTGALGLEAISRGAVSATLFERHLPTLKTIEANVQHLGAAEITTVLNGNTFFLTQRFDFSTEPAWVVFVSPPYDFFVDREKEMLELIERFCEMAPVGSMIVVESDERFDVSKLPTADEWDSRVYRPAVVSLRGIGS